MIKEKFEDEILEVKFLSDCNGVMRDQFDEFDKIVVIELKWLLVCENYLIKFYVI